MSEALLKALHDRDSLRAIKFFGGVTFVLVVCCFLFAWALISFEESKCHDYAAVTGYEVKTITGGVCMIKDPEKGWMSYAERVGRGAKR